MNGEIVAVGGAMASGKSTHTDIFVRNGYYRVNRDEVGGSLKKTGGVNNRVRELHSQGERFFVLDNTYGTVESREALLDLGNELGLPVKMVWVNATKEQCQFLAALRQVRRYNKLLRKEDYKEEPHKSDPNMFPPAAQFAFFKRVVMPTKSEGFAYVEIVPVEITLPEEYKNRAIILDYDGTLRVSKNPDNPSPTCADEVQVLDRRADLLQRKQREGFILCGASNQSGIAKKLGDKKYVPEAGAIEAFEETNRILGVDIDYIYSTERGGVPQSFWPKPMPGMAVWFIEKYKLNPSECIMVGDMTKDKTFSERAGFKFAWANEFFGA